MSKVGKKPVVGAGQDGDGEVKMTDRKKFPNLVDYLTLCAYDDGAARQTSTITVFFERGRVKACLNDRDLGRTGWLTADSLESVLVQLEGALENDELDWRVKFDHRNGRKK